MEIQKDISHIMKELGESKERMIELKGTPARVEEAYDELFAGYKKDVHEVLSVTYPSDMNDLVILKDIPFESHCEHHMVPIIGLAHIGYIPNGIIVGVSKLARLLDCFAHRLQLQERLTMEIASTIQKELNCLGVAVLISAEHFCVSHRGIKKHDVRFVTRYFTGCLKTDNSLRKEFLDTCLHD